MAKPSNPKRGRKDERPPVPDWLPDWRDAENYPAGENVPMERWAWEFLRRNPDYQQDFARASQMPGLDGLEAFQSRKDFSEYFEGTPEIKKDETYGEYLARTQAAGIHAAVGAMRDDLLDKYALKDSAAIQDPASNVPPQFDSLYPYWGPRRIGQPDEMRVGRKDLENVVFLFSLKVGLEAQLKKADEILRRRQMELRALGGIPPKESRRRIEKYPTYLRLLDAKTVKASEEKIRKCIYNGQDKSRTIYHENYSKAKKLRDGGYKLLLSVPIIME